MTGRQRLRIWRFIASLGALVAVVVAVPVVLARVASARFGSMNPLAGVQGPWNWNAGDIGDALSHPLDDDTVIDALVRICLCVAWIAVVVITVTTVVEIVHMVRHRGVAMPTVRGVGWAQGIARFIAVGLLVVMPLVSARPSLAATRAPVVIGGPQTAAALVVAPIDVGPPPAVLTLPAVHGLRSYTVQRGDSIFSIAADLAGHDERQTMVIANEILDANLGSLMPDGQRFTNPAYVEIGWVLVLPGIAPAAIASASPAEVNPAGAAAIETIGDTHVVQPGDTLWDIADEELGAGTWWGEIWDENAGDDMGGGRTFDDPNLILPGWTLELPEENPAGVEIAVEPEPAPPPPAAEANAATPGPPAIAPTASALPSAPSAIPVDADGAVAPTIGSTVAPSTISGSTVTPSTALSPTTSVAPASAPSQPADGRVDRGVAPDAPAPIRIEHAAMLAAGILALVGVRRRQRLRAAAAA